MNKTLYVYKCMRVVSNYRQQAIFIVIIAGLVSLFLSRAALSITTFTLVGLACIHRDFPAQLKKFFANYFLVAMAGLFFIPLISGLWSNDMKEWSDVIRLKLPLFFLPLAFAGSWQLTFSQWKTIALIFIFLVFAGTGWSSFQYWQDPVAANDEYLRAKLFATPLDDDHVRFSWLVSVAVLTIAVLWKQVSRLLKWILFFTALWLVVYLHLLSARTGLFSLYIIVFYFFVRHLFINRSMKHAVTAVAVLIILPVLAWFFIPSFQNRIAYFKYDIAYVKRAEYLPGANDGNRFLSIRAGLAVLKEHPLGVGAGDVENEVFAWYKNNVPGMLETDKIYPASEFLIYGLIAGWPGIIAFTTIMLLPLFVNNLQNRFFWICLNTTAAFSFMFDVGLEVQYGIFSYGMIVLWWWKWFESRESGINRES
jgi:O-antigen ligase